MSFSINESKLEKLLKSSRNSYIVSTSTVGAATENCAPYIPSTEVFSTTYAAPRLVTAGTKQHLLAMRHKIEESGARLSSADDLASEMHDMRRRSY